MVEQQEGVLFVAGARGDGAAQQNSSAFHNELWFDNLENGSVCHVG
jgi:hypothetical protein